ncbi:sugar/nucleoside kinase (ribokinase family) [Diaminobutyricimonas aerilata]|uniref:Sugar/nucleoside kinase (Ribokinase family) n=1 Tax=Diaminobutyricimonas aerilata TaxID=1162967 RepID=A0A2M9CII9_9MICO|nr:carbohydrate kinase family protein [Diaminobutyricimonas aerilata]PJJ71734.1 sugar/nucleoside kinase (ribokinase family) [Diaminobutyricimonas aerilata]
MSAPHPVLVVGDANVDLVLRGDVVPRFGQAEQLLDAADLVLGGSAAIVACGLARLGVPTALAAVVGDDGFGRFTLDALTAAGVATDRIRVDPVVPTGISVILSGADDRAILTLPGTIPTLRPADVALGDARWVHVASPFLMPGFTESLPDVLAGLRAAGAGVSLDTNWDPTERWSGVSGALEHVDVLLPNRAELEAISRVADPLAAGVRLVVKDGAAGGWSLDPAGERHAAPGLEIDVVDTTGAGDSFDAGYLAAIAHGVHDERERVRWATVAGSLSTRAAGGTGAQATLDELRAHL